MYWNKKGRALGDIGSRTKFSVKSTKWKWIYKPLFVDWMLISFLIFCTRSLTMSPRLRGQGRGHWGRQGRRHDAGNKQFPEWGLLIISWSQLLSSSFDWDQCNESDHCVGRMSLEWRRYCGWCEHFWRWWSSSSWKPTLRFIFKILEQQTTCLCVFHLNSGVAYLNCHSNNDDNDGV